MTDNDDQYAERLREVLHQEGSAMGTSDDGLNRILSQAHESGGSERRSAAVLAGAAGGRRGGRRPHRRPRHRDRPGPQRRATTTTPRAVGSSSAPRRLVDTSVSASTTASTSQPSPSCLDVQLIVDARRSDRRRTADLLRRGHERHGQPALSRVPHAAVDTRTPGLTPRWRSCSAATALDPDYSSLWPSGTQIRTPDDRRRLWRRSTSPTSRRRRRGPGAGACSRSSGRSPARTRR